MSETVTYFKRITRSPLTLAMLFARKMHKPVKCNFCVNKTIFGDASKCPVEDDDYSECQQHIKEWMEKEAK